VKGEKTWGEGLGGEGDANSFTVGGGYGPCLAFERGYGSAFWTVSGRDDLVKHGRVRRSFVLVRRSRDTDAVEGGRRAGRAASIRLRASTCGLDFVDGGEVGR